MKNRWLMATGLALACSVALLSYLKFRTNDFPDVSRGPRPANGVPESGSLLKDANLKHWLPPAPHDAMPYNVRSPLFNGADVAQKRRWLWLPAGAKITATSTASGLKVNVPAGTLLWKEFFIRTEMGPRLVERRLMAKVAGKHGFEGWEFYKSHHLPDPPRRVFDADPIEQQAFFLDAIAWQPSQLALPSVQLNLKGLGGKAAEYVFPGRSQCVNCHGGAGGWYADGSDSLAFGLSELVTNENTRIELLRRGWLDAQSIATDAEQSFEELAAETDHLVDMLRANCLSCHNSSRNALARRTGFILDPRKRYGPEELARELRRRGVMMGADTLPILTADRVDESEIMLRLEGQNRRRRMPPVEGGVATRHEELIDAIRKWSARIRTTGKIR